ncbi:unnamed protein product [Ixodes persulcatus]
MARQFGRKPPFTPASTTTPATGSFCFFEDASRSETFEWNVTDKCLNLGIARMHCSLLSQNSILLVNSLYIKTRFLEHSTTTTISNNGTQTSFSSVLQRIGNKIIFEINLNCATELTIVIMTIFRHSLSHISNLNKS